MISAGCLGVAGAFFDQRFPAQHVGGGVEQHALGFQAVATGAAGFLLVVLDGFRHGGVNDAAHVAAVDTHAEGDGGGDDVEIFRGEIVLGAAAFVGFHAGVIESGAQPVGLEKRGHRFGVLAADAVDDRRLTAMALQDFQHLGARIDARHDAIDEIRTIEGADEDRRIAQAQLLRRYRARTRSVAVAV